MLLSDCFLHPGTHRALEQRQHSDGSSDVGWLEATTKHCDQVVQSLGMLALEYPETNTLL
jgi:hypothetical protein